MSSKPVDIFNLENLFSVQIISRLPENERAHLSLFIEVENDFFVAYIYDKKNNEKHHKTVINRQRDSFFNNSIFDEKYGYFLFGTHIKKAELSFSETRYITPVKGIGQKYTIIVKTGSCQAGDVVFLEKGKPNNKPIENAISIEFPFADCSQLVFKK